MTTCIRRGSSPRSTTAAGAQRIGRRRGSPASRSTRRPAEGVVVGPPDNRARDCDAAVPADAILIGRRLASGEVRQGDEHRMMGEQGSLIGGRTPLGVQAVPAIAAESLERIADQQRPCLQPALPFSEPSHAVAAWRRAAQADVRARGLAGHRHAALRPPAGRHDQGHRAALLEHARPPGRASLRLGLPRPADRGPGPGGPRPGKAPAEIRTEGRRCPSTSSAARMVQTYVAEWRKTVTRMGRWVDFDNDYKTMDRRLHGVGVVGLQAALGARPGLQEPPHHALQLEADDAAVELRSQQQLQRCPGSGHHRALRRSRPGRVRRGWRTATVMPAGLDDHALDPAAEPGALRRPRDRLRRRQGCATR